MSNFKNNKLINNTILGSNIMLKIINIENTKKLENA